MLGRKSLLDVMAEGGCVAKRENHENRGAEAPSPKKEKSPKSVALQSQVGVIRRAVWRTSFCVKL